jgi:uroporphyrin-3 C-methyltransferase
LVALKLVKQSDIEGIYLELAALANQVDALPLVPKAYNYQNDAAEPENETIEADAKGNSVSKFFSSLSDYVRIVRHSERPAAILPPDESAYLQLNLRLMIEQAQLALLREEIQIYQQSLTDATSWLEKYFPSTQAADQYVAELKRLREIDIVITLPDISESLGMLQNYISVLHKLDEESAPSAQVKQEEGA